MECQLSSGDCRESYLSSHTHPLPRPFSQPFLDTCGIQRALVSYSRSSNRILEDALPRVYQGSPDSTARQGAAFKALQAHAGLMMDNALGPLLWGLRYFFFFLMSRPHMPHII